MKLQVFLKFYFLLIIALKIIKTETVKWFQSSTSQRTVTPRVDARRARHAVEASRVGNALTELQNHYSLRLMFRKRVPCVCACTRMCFLLARPFAPLQRFPFAINKVNRRTTCLWGGLSSSQWNMQRGKTVVDFPPQSAVLSARARQGSAQVSALSLLSTLSLAQVPLGNMPGGGGGVSLEKWEPSFWDARVIAKRRDPKGVLLCLCPPPPGEDGGCVRWPLFLAAAVASTA